jgi:NAD(P)-dependent dehydrogenase (short-subunit alcohol dehydrogenase family)
MADTFFTNKVAVITGAGGLLCSQIAKDLASRGVKVALIGRTRESLEKVAKEIESGGGVALVAPADVTRGDDLELGPCHMLVNGAGGNNAKAVTTLDQFDEKELSLGVDDATRGFFNLDLAHYNSVVQINTIGTVLPSQIFGRDMASLRRGSVLNFASMNTYRPLTRNAAYAMAKAAIGNFTQWLACYLAPAGIRVNGVAPGFFANERSRKILMTEDGGLTPRGQNVFHHTPMKRFGESPDLLGCVRWLLNDDEAAFVTGVTIPVDGGFTAASGV